MFTDKDIKIKMSSPKTVRLTRPQARVDIASFMKERLIDQDTAVDKIVPYVQMHQSGLAPEGRPSGVFLLMGPTGTGKSFTVEVLAEALHGTRKSLLRVDCGEFQMEHEVAKLIGAPPGYLGHKETTPILTQARLNAVTTSDSGLSIVLFDEIEKAAPSMIRLLLGVLDKATLKLGDNTNVNFENSLIFMTSNLGAREIKALEDPDYGFASGHGVGLPTGSQLDRITAGASKRRFPPEFVNRIDETIRYEHLGSLSVERILDLQLAALQEMISTRLGSNAFSIDVTPAAKEWLIAKGVSKEYGARELKRLITRKIVQPLAAGKTRGEVEAGSTWKIDVQDGELVYLEQDPFETNI